jgi:hypothetical protein
MKIYRSKQLKLPGRSYSDVERLARSMHNTIARGTKRTPYIKSIYFNKEKVFIDVFWSHLNQKSRSDRKRRLKLYAAAIDLIQNSPFAPIEKSNPNGKNETVYRFAGSTANDELFYVQIKQDSKTKRKYFMSVFPPK